MAIDVHYPMKHVPDTHRKVDSAYADQLIKLKSERQSRMKDAWLTAIGHKRPGMNVGLFVTYGLTPKPGKGKAGWQLGEFPKTGWSVNAVLLH